MKTYIITGASDGIGRATAILMSERMRSGNIVLIGKSEAKLKETRSMLHPGLTPVVMPFDLSSLHEIPALVERIYLRTKSVDCLLNIAGYTDPQPLLQTTVENLMMTYGVNVFAPIVLTRECVRYMKEDSCGPKKILNVASTAGITPRPGWLSYASSKAAMISVSETLTEELSEYRIKTYSISPGRCATALRRRLAPEEDQSTIMQPMDVANIICNLVSDDENCLDGQNIVIRKKWG